MELLDVGRIFFALIAVLGLIGLFALLARKAGIGGAGFNLSRDKRLSLVEVLPLDNRRRAAIIKCDDREHLVVLNPNNVTVIERGLQQHRDRREETSPASADFLEEAGQPSFADALRKLRSYAPGVSIFKKTPTADAPTPVDSDQKTDAL